VNRSTLLYQTQTLVDLNKLTATAASLAFTPVVFLLLVILFLVRPIVEKIEDNKLAVLRLFLDVPIPLVRVFRARINRRVAVHENAEDGAFVDPNVVEEEDEDAVIATIVQQQRAEDAASAAAGEEIGASRRQNRERHAKADAFLRESGFIRRHLTMLKIVGYWICSLMYFVPTYTEFFGNFRPSLLSKPLQVNWASHRTLQSRKVSAHIVEYLMQNYTAVYFPGPDEQQHPHVELDSIEKEIAFSYEIITALGMGSEYFGTLAPETTEESKINFENPCFAVPATDCNTFADKAMTNGLYAAYLDWHEKAALTLQMVANAVKASSDAAVAIAAAGGLNATALKAAQQVAQFAILNATLNSFEVTQILAFDYDYLAPATTVATLQYANAPTAMFASVEAAKTLVLVLWVVFTLALHFFFFGPLVYKLHDEHRRTTSMVWS
jgi:hypothetical protein